MLEWEFVRVMTDCNLLIEYENSHQKIWRVKIIEFLESDK